MTTESTHTTAKNPASLQELIDYLQQESNKLYNQRETHKNDITLTLTAPGVAYTAMLLEKTVTCYDKIEMMIAFLKDIPKESSTQFIKDCIAEEIVILNEKMQDYGRLLAHPTNDFVWSAILRARCDGSSIALAVFNTMMAKLNGSNK